MKTDPKLRAMREELKLEEGCLRDWRRIVRNSEISVAKLKQAIRKYQDAEKLTVQHIEKMARRADKLPATERCALAKAFLRAKNISWYCDKRMDGWSIKPAILPPSVMKMLDQLGERTQTSVARRRPGVIVHESEKGTERWIVYRWRFV